MTLLGVDVGTTGCKAVVVGADGAPLCAAYREYPLLTPRAGWAELDPDRVWEAVCAAVRQVTAAASEPPQALAVAGLGEAVTPIDAAGRPLGPMIVSFDGRARDCHERLVATLGAERITAVCGLEPQPHYSVAKWQWLAEELPDVYRRAAKLACVGDMLAVRLGLEAVIDYTMAARTLAFDVAGGCWSSEILGAAGIEVAKLAKPAPSGTVIGAIPPRQARDLGLAAGALLVAGGLDQACAAFGAGIGVEPDGPVLLSLGTVAVLAAVLGGDRPPPTTVPTTPHVTPGASLAIAGSPAGGATLRWYRDRFGAADIADADSGGRDVYDLIVAGAADVETDVIALPHFAGSRTAFADPQATAALVGLTFATDRRHVVRALLEGVALETAVMADRLAVATGPVASLRATGGASRSRTWMQIFADVLGVPVESTASRDAAAVGAALIAGAATGLTGNDPAHLPAVMRCEPEPSHSGRYGAKLERYRSLYEALAGQRLAGGQRYVGGEGSGP